jgi:hypothetical protein
MTENIDDIQIISTKVTNFQADRVLRFGQVIVDLNSTLLINMNLPASQRVNLVLPDIEADPSQYRKIQFLAIP